METAIVSLICIALIVFGGMTMSRGFLTSVDTTTMGLEQWSIRDETIMRTKLDTVSASVNVARDQVDVTLENEGQTKLAEIAGEVSARDMPEFTLRFLQHYIQKRSKYPDFGMYLEKEGRAKISSTSKSG